MASYFDEISRNRMRSLLLMAVFFLLFAGIIYVLAWAFGAGVLTLPLLAIGMVLVALYAYIVYNYGSKLVLRVSGAQPADRKQYPTLYEVVEGLSLATQNKIPGIYVIQDNNPNAFATGKKSDPSIAVTTGLLATMNKAELQGVLAHEISHVADNDILYMTVAVAFAGAIGLIAGYLRLSAFFGGMGGGRGRGNGGLILLVALVIGVLAPIFALLIRLAVSRRREYMADANGARLTRSPRSLASALAKIKAYTQAPGATSVKHASEVSESIYFANPFTASNLSNLFSTHPPIDERIKRLQAMY